MSLLGIFIVYFLVLIVLRCTHKYFSEVLSTYLSTFTKCVLSTYSSTFKTVSTQYLLKYIFLVLASSLLPGKCWNLSETLVNYVFLWNNHWTPSVKQ